METTTSVSRRTRGTQSSRKPVYRVWSGVRTSGASLRSTNGRRASSSASRSPEAMTTASVSRRWPGPSATTTDDAPRRRSAFAAATTMRGSVLIDEPRKNSTRFGLSSTERRRTSTSTSRSPSSKSPSRSPSYVSARSTATDERPGFGKSARSNGGGPSKPPRCPRGAHRPRRPTAAGSAPHEQLRRVSVTARPQRSSARRRRSRAPPMPPRAAARGTRRAAPRPRAAASRAGMSSPTRGAGTRGAPGPR